MKIAVFVAAFIVTTNAYAVFQSEWEQWKDFHVKSYSEEEEIRRKYIWETNLRTVIKHNEEAANGMHTFTLGMNQFADLDDEEWKNLILGDVTRPEGMMSFCNRTYVGSAGATTVAKKVDWRKQGYVTPVKNQLACGSCWAFSATGSLEGQHFKKTGKLVSLSEQNLMDCSRPEGDKGCQGGLMDFAFEYIYKNHGIDTEASYPYKANNSKSCDYNPKNSGATLTGCVDIEQGSERALLEAVEQIGPISVAIDASKRTFHLYQSGVYYDPECSSVHLDHGVLAVGYGTKKGQDYWLVKNSWGEMWGEKGYVMMSRNKGNNCGIATQASYPTV